MSIFKLSNDVFPTKVNQRFDKSNHLELTRKEDEKDKENKHEYNTYASRSISMNSDGNGC
jgi:hypothetical protein